MNTAGPAMRHPVFPHANVLVVGPNQIGCLLPSTIISQVESLLDSHRTEDAVDLANQLQRKLLGGKGGADEEEVLELRYVYQRIGFQCLGETQFESAGENLLSGELDPRVLVSYFPDLRGSLFSESDSLELFAGVAEHMPTESSIDDIIAANLVMNYSPHLKPDTRSAPPTAELRKILGSAARAMLEQFLRRSRTRRQIAGTDKTVESTKVSEVVDTVLVKIFAESEKTSDLKSLLQQPHNVVLSDIEPALERFGQYSALCLLYRQRGDDEKLLNVWSKLADGDWTDEDIPDPLSDIMQLLMDRRDRALTQKWAIWLTKKDPERALKLLTTHDTKRRRDRTQDDLALLPQLQEINPAIGEQYLEYLVLQRRISNPQLHVQLASICADQLLESLAVESVAKLWRAKASSYTSSRSETSFLSYFASTTPESEYKRIRLKSILFFQGSPLYDVDDIRQRLLPHEKILKLELAILDGKLKNHRAALSALATDLRDAASAEAYCILGGEVVPVKVAHTVGEKSGLSQWASALFPSHETPRPGMPIAPALERQKTVDEGLKKTLLKILLEVYMSGGPSTAERTAHILNAQAGSLDVVDVLSLMPPDWPLHVISTFLARSFRRTLHTQHEGQIIKAISAAQNLEVSDSSWLVLREQGAVVEEAVDDEGEGDGADEKVFDEKAGLRPEDSLVVTDIHPSPQRYEADVASIQIMPNRGTARTDHDPPDSIL